MNSPELPEQVALTGADHFILALEQHAKFNQTGGNMCHYVIDVEGVLTAEFIYEKVNNHALIQWLSRFSIHETFFVKKWVIGSISPILVTETVTEEEYPTFIFDHSIQKTKGPLFCLNVLHRKNNSTRLILSWHHLLMDGYGAVLLIKALTENSFKIEPVAFEQNKVRHSFLKAVKAKFFVQNSAKGNLSDIFNSTKKQGIPFIKTLSFSKENSQKIKENAIAAGAMFGASPFYLSVIAKALKNTLESRGEKKIGFWVPVPKNDRKIGAKWPLVGNHLSFLFYRFLPKDLRSIESTVQAINTQMVYQIKEKIPQAYSSLLHYLKMAPSPLYYYWIKGPKGKTLSSFLFTIASDHPEDFNTLFDAKITNALSLPPNTYPPGITFAITQFQQKTQLSILSYTDVLNHDELNTLEKVIKLYLIEK